jgi:peptidyl-prolyl cis-trans isomerase D
MRSAAKYIWLFIVVAFVGGFLLAETSGLIGRTPLTPTTPVAEVNGREILYNQWQQRVQQAMQSQQQEGRVLTQDEAREIENRVLDEMIMQVLLDQEYRKRGITVSDEELREFARYAPPPFMYNQPNLQTDGRFDPAKYQRLLTSPEARSGGLLLALENYYRTEIPKEKLFEHVTDGVYLTDAELWRSWQDERDSAQVSYVAFRPDIDSAALAAVSDAEIRARFDRNRKEFERPGHAWLSVVHIPRTITAADSAATRARLMALRAEIAGGAKFEDVAKRESHDSVSGAEGGDLGRGGKGRFVKEFEDAAYKLRPRELSQPVLTQFGYHLIRVDDKKGDTLALRHILLRVAQGDSAATATDRKADSLAQIAAGSNDGATLDTAAKQLNLQISRIEAVEGRPAALGFQSVPSASAWAFGGALKGEVSELFDDQSGYWLARLDSIIPGGEPRIERVRDEIRATIAREKAVAKAMPEAQQFAQSAAASGLDAAARAANLTVIKSPTFTRLSFVPGLSQFSPALGAAFTVPVGAVSAPIADDEAGAVYVIRVDRRVNADRTAFEKELETVRRQRLSAMKQQRLQLFLDDLRKSAKIEDHRKDINATARRLESTT